jgi:hypothetical protein
MISCYDESNAQIMTGGLRMMLRKSALRGVLALP